MKTKTFTRNVTLVMLALLIATVTMVLLPMQTASAEEATQDMHRLYNPNSGEHFYTASTVERDHLMDVGWSYEGTGWVAPVTSDTPVYRLYNANAGDHHYTTSVVERDHLVSVGWNDEGIGWYSDDSQRVPLYRQYNPNAIAGSHNYTTSGAERDNLVSVGWQDEGIAWYGVAEGVAVVPDNTTASEPAPAPVDNFADYESKVGTVDENGIPYKYRYEGYEYAPKDSWCHNRGDKTCHEHDWVAGTQYKLSFTGGGSKIVETRLPWMHCGACGATMSGTPNGKYENQL